MFLLSLFCAIFRKYFCLVHCSESGSNICLKPSCFWTPLNLKLYEISSGWGDMRLRWGEMTFLFKVKLILHCFAHFCRLDPFTFSAKWHWSGTPLFEPDFHQLSKNRQDLCNAHFFWLVVYVYPVVFRGSLIRTPTHPVRVNRTQGTLKLIYVLSLYDPMVCCDQNFKHVTTKTITVFFSNLVSRMNHFSVSQLTSRQHSAYTVCIFVSILNKLWEYKGQ